MQQYSMQIDLLPGEYLQDLEEMRGVSQLLRRTEDHEIPRHTYENERK